MINLVNTVKIHILSISFNAPWTSLQTEARNQILNFATSFLVPLIAVALLIAGIAQIPGCVLSKKNGGSDFGTKLTYCLGSFVFAFGIGSIWAILRAAI